LFRCVSFIHEVGFIRKDHRMSLLLCGVYRAYDNLNPGLKRLRGSLCEGDPYRQNNEGDGGYRIAVDGPQHT